MMIMLTEDSDCDVKLKFEDVLDYVMVMAYPTLILSSEEIRSIFDCVDANKVGTLNNKKQIELFLSLLMKHNK